MYWEYGSPRPLLLLAALAPALCECVRGQEQQLPLLPAASIILDASSTSRIASSSNISIGTTNMDATGSNRLYGRFLHITDMHPDGFYKYGASVSSGCHSNKPKRGKAGGKPRAGYWGTGSSECDSPQRLIETTLDWLSSNWQRRSSAEQDGFDYIIWTGDSARHDLDSDHPRTRDEIYQHNRWTLAQIQRSFPGVAIVPSIGNNDIFPHNIMFPGPNEITRTYASIWSSVIPESEFHVFQQGGYFVKEVIPDALAVLSLNTLYFYDNNKAVDGCKKYTKRTPEKDRDPGSSQLDWMEVQLKQLRKRRMQVQIIGHVPPTAGNYFKRCYSRYTDIVLRYQDTVIGQHYGHMNVDALFIQEGPGATVKKLDGTTDEEDGEKDEDAGGLVSITASDGIVDDLRDEFDTLPGQKRTNLDRYNFFWAAPSVVPTWWPSVRVWTYNTTRESAFCAQDVLDAQVDEEEEDDDDGEQQDERRYTSSRSHRHPKPGKRRRKHHKPYHSSASSPSRTNRFLTPLGFSQWVMDIDEENKGFEKWRKREEKKRPNHHRKGRWLGWMIRSIMRQDEELEKPHDEKNTPPKPQYQLEYATYEPEQLWRAVTGEIEVDFDNGDEVHRSKWDRPPVPRHLLQLELKRYGLSKRTPGHKMGGTEWLRKLPRALRHRTDWNVPCLTLDHVMHVARRLASEDRFWRRYVKRIFSGSGGPA